MGTLLESTEQQSTTPEAAPPVKGRPIDYDKPLSELNTLGSIVELGKIMGASGLIPDMNNAAKATACMIFGSYFGLSPMASLTGVHWVKGKPMLGYAVLLSKIKQHPRYNYKIKESTDTQATVEFYEDGELIGSETFTIKQAQRQQTQNLEKFPDTMLLARAVSKGVKKYCPDVINGMPIYVEGELEGENGLAAAGSKRDEIKAKMEASEILDGDKLNEPKGLTKEQQMRLDEILSGDPLTEDQLQFEEDEVAAAYRAAK